MPPAAALRAWTDPAALSLWFTSGMPDAVYRTAGHRGHEYSVTSAQGQLSIRGVCLDLGQHGFDLTWQLRSRRIDMQSADIVSVRLFRAGPSSTDVFITHDAHGELSEDVIERFWSSRLERLVALRPACSTAPDARTV